MKMKRLIIIGMVLLIASCAMYNLPKGATSEEWKAATCTDAQTAFDLSIAMLDGSIDGKARIYWEAYKLGATIFLARYCP